mmetsp:Transcript_26233/g.68912  ORF Transcript_26233/g.68912 Transcript_26233/m.68912 type:complete len:1036 (+) Transcript_26233:145-3252(+)
MGKKNKNKRKDDDDDWENEIEAMVAEMDGDGAAKEDAPAAGAAGDPVPADDEGGDEDAGGDSDENDAAAPEAAGDAVPEAGRLLTKKEKERIKKEKEKAKKAAKKARQKEQQKAAKAAEAAEVADGDAPDQAEASAEGAEAAPAADDSDGNVSTAADKDAADGSSTAGLTKAQKKKLKAKEKKKAEKAATATGGAAAPKPAGGKKSALGKALKAKLEAEARAQKEEEERLAELRRQEEERIRQIEEEERREEERKEEKKRKEKEKRERLKAEGKLLTKKQKKEKEKFEAMQRQLEAEGRLPVKGVRPQRQRRNKKSDEKAAAEKEAAEAAASTDAAAEPAEAADGGDDAADDWEAEDWEADEDKAEEDTAQGATMEESAAVEAKPDKDVAPATEVAGDADAAAAPAPDAAADAATPEVSPEEEVERLGSAYDDYGGVEMGQMRSPICVVMGHVDTGKTKILDKIRKTTVQDGEAGGITQQIGASFFPIKEISKQMNTVAAARKFVPKVPGLLIMDTPGHESFSNLRDRGSSLCNIAVLVIDIMHGIEPQTEESINLLKKKKVPFIVALNKVDRIDGWKSTANGAIQNCLKKQKEHTQQQFEILSQRAMLNLNELGFNCAMYYDNPDPRTYISIVPTSAHTGEGIPDLLYWIIKLTQTTKSAAKAITYTGDLNCTVLEVKKIDGYGTTIDVILADGELHAGDRIVLPGLEGPITTTIRSLLMPEPLKELRVKNAYRLFKSVPAANGVKIAARDLEKAVAGLQLQVAKNEEHEAQLVDGMSDELDAALKAMKTTEKGVHVQASTVGSMEALLEFLRTSKVPVSGLSIGPVHKKDVTRCSIQLEKDRRLALILAFDVPVEREAQLEADRLGIKIFTAEIIYHLFESFKKHQADEKERLQREFANVATFPSRVQMIPDFIFNTRDPIVVGVKVLDGQLKIGTPLVARTEDKGLVDIGVVGSIEIEHVEVPIAKVGEEVCVKILPVGDKKMLGRHFEVTDELVSRISRDSIEAVKKYFKDEMSKSDWKLIIQLKKVFDII